MQILIDTNIFIQREDNKIVQDELQELIRILHELGYKIVLHPLSIEEIKKDKNKERRDIIISKIKSYPLIEQPPMPEKDAKFASVTGEIKNEHDTTDINLLYAVHKNAVDFLITEDRGIHAKANKLNLSERVFDIDEALASFRITQKKEKTTPISPPALNQEFAYNIDINDPFFDDLKDDYPGFESWWKKISKKKRDAWIYKPGKKLGAILIYKIEDESIDSIPPLPKKKRLKICTLKASHTGYKMGELFIKMSIEYAIKNDIDELYLTHFIKDNDYLVPLIWQYGFREVAKKADGESIFIKRLVPEDKVDSISKIYEEFYPTFYDGEDVNKYIIPIRPEYHIRLFTECRDRQTGLFEHLGGFIIEGNTIEKAYLCHSRIRGVKKGDIVLFYRSDDQMKITSLGIVDSVHNNLRDPDKIIKYVGKRTVYSRDEIQGMAKKPTKVILFRWHFHFPKPISYKKLLEKNIVKGSIQSIQKCLHKDYLKIKRDSGIDERFTIWDI